MTALDLTLETPNNDWGEVVELTARRASSSRLDPIASLRAAAERHFTGGNWDTARHLIQQLVAKLDTHEDRFELSRLYCKLACIAEKQSHDTEAIELFLISFEFDTTHLPTLRGMASALFRTEKWNNARRIFQIILIQHRDALSQQETAQALYELGEIHRRLDQLDRASDCFRKALDLDQKHVPALRAWSELAMMREDWDEAFETRELLYGLTGGDEVESLMQHATLAEKLGDPLRAIDVVCRARQLGPRDTRVLRALIRLYDETSQTKKKIEVLSALGRVLTDPTQRRDLYTELARAWVEQDDMGQAVESLNHALDADPTFVEAFEEIEKFLFEARDWPHLAASYRRMIRRTPKESKARLILWRSLGQVYERGLKNSKAAAVAYETVLRVDPSATDIALRLSDLYAQKRETAPKAIAIYQRLLATSNDQVVPARKLFELYSGLDQLDRAYCALGALVMLRAASETEMEAYQLLQKRLPKAPTGALTEQLWREHLLHPACRTSLMESAAMLYRAAPTLFMEGQRQLGLKRKEKLDPSSARAKLRFYDICSSLRALLDVDEVEHYHRTGTEAPRVLAGAPPVMFAGEEHDSFKAMKTCQLRWTIAREMACARPELAPAFALSPEDLGAAMEAALSIVSPQGSGVDHGIDAKRIAHWKKALARNLNPVAARAMQQPLGACLERQEMRDLAGYLEGAEQTALRAALLVAQDCAVVQDNDQARVRELVVFALGEDHFLLREKLSMTIV